MRHLTRHGIRVPCPVAVTSLGGNSAYGLASSSLLACIAVLAGSHGQVLRLNICRQPACAFKYSPSFQRSKRALNHSSLFTRHACHSFKVKPAARAHSPCVTRAAFHLAAMCNVRIFQPGSARTRDSFLDSVAGWNAKCQDTRHTHGQLRDVRTRRGPSAVMHALLGLAGSIDALDVATERYV
jgi:hypothetical protein